MSTSVENEHPHKRRLESGKPHAAKRLKTGKDEPLLDFSSQNSREQSPRASGKHTTKERKRNRSSRIHSLRKQLARRALPSDIQREKERELAALIHDQNKMQTQKQAKKVLEKYHYVRFVERQKAEKRLKQLRKHMETADEDEVHKIRQQIQEMETNRNYAVYAPLDQKYIAVFAKRQAQTQGEDDVSQIAHPPKPAMWYVVEEAMRQGQSHLEALRDGKTRPGATTADSHIKSSSTQLSGRSLTTKTKTATKDHSSHNVILNNTKRPLAAGGNSNGAESSEESSSDGGFFEK